MTRTWDAVVIGAGPAGSVAARGLARRGAGVLLVDRSAFPRTKVCGCCLNGAALAALESIGLGHVPAACGAVPLHTLLLAAGRSSAELRMPTGAAVSRSALDAALVQESEAAGATFLPETMAKVEAHAGGSRLVRLEGTASSALVAARIVVLATGLSNGDSKPQAGSRLGGGVVVPSELVPGFFAPGTIFMATGRGGYVGLVRLEDDRLDVAAALDPDFVRTSGGLGPAAEAILARTGWPAIPGLAALTWKGTPALTRQRATVAEPRLFAVGDAAGYVEPFTGEGMAWAIASAAALAPSAHRAIHSCNDSGDTGFQPVQGTHDRLEAGTTQNDSYIREWRQTHARIVRRRQGICRVAARVLRSPLLTGIAVRVLGLAPLLSRPVVFALNRPAKFHGLHT